MVPVTSYDTAGSYLLLGGDNGSIYYIGRWCYGSLFVDLTNLCHSSVT